MTGGRQRHPGGGRADANATGLGFLVVFRFHVDRYNLVKMGTGVSVCKHNKMRADGNAFEPGTVGVYHDTCQREKETFKLFDDEVVLLRVGAVVDEKERGVRSVGLKNTHLTVTACSSNQRCVGEIFERTKTKYHIFCAITAHTCECELCVWIAVRGCWVGEPVPSVTL